MRTLVVIPTYQEAANITALLAAIHGAAPDADVLVVDDNSPDGTAALAEAAAAEAGSVKVLRRPGKVVSRNAIEDGLYGFNDDVGSNALEVLVSRLRKKLISVGADIQLHTVRGVGYMAMDRG